MYDKSSWLFALHNLFKVRDTLTSEQSYRRLIDGITDFEELFDEGMSPQEAYREFWN